MSWDELRTRVRQEVSKRLDVALYGGGRQPGSDGLRSQSCSEGKFFFPPDELPNRVSLLHKHLPHAVQDVVKQADEICQHRFRLLGYDNLDYGSEIDWHLDVVHGKRTPLIPWFKINFLDFSEAGDHKITWELSRHQHLVTLAEAWLLTNREKYANEAVEQWYSWQRSNPYPLGVNWASSLEVAFRTLAWLWLRQLLARSTILTVSYQKDLLRALALNGRHIDRYLSTYFSPNTHLVGEAVALFFIGTLCPQISASEKWKKLAWRIIQDEAQHQVRPDGVYFEQSLYYHVYALDFLLHARLLASRNGIEIPSGFDEVIRKMLAVVQAVSQVGPPDGFGDDDGGRVFNPRRNRAQHMTDPLAIGAALFQDKRLRANATLTAEAIWLFGAEAVQWTAQSDEIPRGPESHSYKDGGLYIAASRDPFPQQTVIDAGPQGTGRSGHGHADALSIKLSFSNRLWLVDAGTFAYVTPGGERQAFRGTRAHNTLAVDRLDQAQSEGPFAWSALPITRVECWIPGPTFSLFSGQHSGYERLSQPVRHRRFIFHLHGAFWLVRDVAEGQGSHLLETSWHFAPDLEVARRDNTFLVSPSSGNLLSAGQPNHLTLLPVYDPRWTSELLSEHVSPAYGTTVPAPVLRCSARVAARAEHAMLLLPALDANQKMCDFVRAGEQLAHAQEPESAYQYEADGTSHSMVFGRSPSVGWTFGPWTCDAKFLYYRVRDRLVQQLIFCEGSFLKFQGESLLSQDSTLQWLDWTRETGVPKAVCSDESVASSFESVTILSRTLA
jgi:hypothetical protein